MYRNYFVPLGGRLGQSRDSQIDCLSDLGAALGNETRELWRMRNGYALCSESGLGSSHDTHEAGTVDVSSATAQHVLYGA